MTDYLVAVSIGPVQDFIAASRKTRDLWFGSMLLSEMSRAAAKRLDLLGATLIFPSLSGGGAGKTPVANKLLAILHDGDPKIVLAAVEKAAQTVLENAIFEVEGTERLNESELVNWTLVREQAESFLEFYAAWRPYKEATYRDDRIAVEHLLAGRKALRDFKAPPRHMKIAKSSLDASRETVFQTAEDNPVNSRNKLTEDEKATLKIKGGEQLDGISLIKRHADENRFVSVSRVAIDPLIRRMEDSNERSTDLKRLFNMANSLRKTRLVEWFDPSAANGLTHYAAFPFDCQLFYRDGTAEELSNAIDMPPSKPGEATIKAEEQRKTAQSFFTLVSDACTKLEISEPPAYLAVLAADGDRMGKAIWNMHTSPEHIAFSERLSKFAAEADRIVRDHHGAMIYSGGDDVLAFLPVDTALCCADALHTAFKSVNDPKAPMPEPVTLSVGVAIGHYHAHLNDLLKWARDAEHTAKDPDCGNRNALAVSVHTGSSGEGAVTVAHQWTLDANPVTDRWQKWVRWHRQNLFPDGAAYELQKLAKELRAFDQERSEAPRFPAGAMKSLLDLETERILKRKRGEHGKRPLTPSEIAKVVEATGGTIAGLERVADELVIARRIAEITTTALGPWKPQQDACKERPSDA